MTPATIDRLRRRSRLTPAEIALAIRDQKRLARAIDVAAKGRPIDIERLDDARSVAVLAEALRLALDVNLSLN